MSNALFILKPNKEVENVYSINLSVFAGIDLLIQRSAQEAISVLDEISFVDLIICEEEIDGEETCKELYNYIKEENLDIPLLIIGEKENLKEYGIMINNKMKIKDVVGVCAKITGVNPQELNKKITSEFYGIPISYFESLQKSDCDIYQKSNNESGEGEGVYFKAFEINKPIDKSYLEKLKVTGHKYLYIMSSMRTKFVDGFNNWMTGQMSASDDNKKFKVLEKAREIISGQVREHGITEETIKMSDIAVNECFENVAKTPVFKEFLSKLFKNTESYHFRHSQLISYISFHLIGCMEWGNEEQKMKMAFVSFFHDIMLLSDKLAQIHSMEELESLNLSTKERELVMGHAHNTAAMIQKHPTTPIGADIIIKQHHGTLNGLGFIEKPDASISPLSAVFYIAECLSRAILRAGTVIDISKFVETQRNILPKTNKYNSLLNALEESLGESQKAA